MPRLIDRTDGGCDAAGLRWIIVEPVNGEMSTMLKV